MKFAFLLLLGGCAVFFMWQLNVTTTQPQPQSQPHTHTQSPSYMPSDWFFEQRAWPSGKIDQQQYFRALKKSIAMQQTRTGGAGVGYWEQVGPTNIGGRISDVEMHDLSLTTIYAGTASGGVFKSMDGGDSWYPIFDQSLSLSIGDLAIAPSDSNIIYVGTGEANCGFGSVTYDGYGIYKSTDGGVNWTHLGLDSTKNTAKIVVHPTSPDTVFVATMGNLFADNPQRGIYRSQDGGSTWTNILFLNDSTGGSDMVIHPSNPDTIYVTMWQRVRRHNWKKYGGSSCGVYRSYDGGDTWIELTVGLPSAGPDKGRAFIDISKSNPSTLYLEYADSLGNLNGVYKTTNNGDTWTKTTASPGVFPTPSGYWYGGIHIDPANPNIVYALGLRLWKTTNGGNSWSVITNSIHVDQHRIIAHPLNSNFMILGNDGGLFRSTNAGATWTHLDSMANTQFYTCALDPQLPYRYYGGTQDNGTVTTQTGAIDSWFSIYGGDGFYVLIDPLDNSIQYVEYQWGNFAKSVNSGFSFSWSMFGINTSDRFNWNMPVVFNPQNSKSLYCGSHRIYKSTDRADFWTPISPDLTSGQPIGNKPFGTITTISVSPVDSNIIYAGADDGNVSVTLDGGSNWTNISPALPVRWVTRVAADPVDSFTAYVTISGYQFNDPLPHVFRTRDAGQTWDTIVTNLPSAPATDIVIRSDSTERLYLSTDVGIFTSADTGNTWQIFNDSLPRVPVTDLTLDIASGTLLAATYGRSMYKYDIGTSFTVLEEPLPTMPISILILPNPSFGSVEIRVKFSDFDDGKLEIIDLSGKKIALLKAERTTSTTGTFIWNGKDFSNNSTSPGIYLCRFKQSEQTIIAKLVRLN